MLPMGNHTTSQIHLKSHPSCSCKENQLLRKLIKASTARKHIDTSMASFKDNKTLTGSSSPQSFLLHHTEQKSSHFQLKSPRKTKRSREGGKSLLPDFFKFHQCKQLAVTFELHRTSCNRERIKSMEFRGLFDGPQCKMKLFLSLFLLNKLF